MSCSGYTPASMIGADIGPGIIIPKAPVLFCIDCGIEIDEHDVTANLNTWGAYRGYCSDDIENHLNEEE